jgi:hypothetical protein
MIASLSLTVRSSSVFGLLAVACQYACSPEPASSPPELEAGVPSFDTGAPRAEGSSPVRPSPPVPTSTGSDARGNPTSPGPDAQSTGPCAAAGLLACDDFESMTVGVAPTGYVLESGGGAPGEISVTDQTAHGGRHSVFVNGDTFSSLFTKKGPPVFPQPSNSYYVRFWIRVSDEFPSGHATFVEAGPDDTKNENEIRIGFHVNQLEVNRMPGDAEQLSNGGNYNDPTSGIHFVETTWHCLEVLFDGGNDELRVWFEGNEVPELHVTDWNRGDVGWSPTYAAIRFGYEMYGSPPMQVWYDDIAIGTARIGCSE